MKIALNNTTSFKGQLKDYDCSDPSVMKRIIPASVKGCEDQHVWADNHSIKKGDRFALMTGDHGNKCSFQIMEFDSISPGAPMAENSMYLGYRDKEHNGHIIQRLVLDSPDTQFFTIEEFTAVAKAVADALFKLVTPDKKDQTGK